jgi:hypothetical protein
MPFSWDAADAAWGIWNTITTWARHCAEERGLTITGTVASWLIGQVEWLRHRPEAPQAFDELHDAIRRLRRVVDQPPPRMFAGHCPCGTSLYGIAGAPAVTCRSCGTTYDTEAQRGMLIDAAREQLFTAAELATLAVRAGYADDYQRTRNLINQWATRGLLVAHGTWDGQPTYPFAETMPRLMTTKGRVA